MDRPKIEVCGLRYGVGGTEILAGVDALVPPGCEREESVLAFADESV